MNPFVIVIGCTKKKKLYRCKASEMYSESVLFNKTVSYIRSNYNCDFVILSAEYGIITSDVIIEPYDTVITKCDSSRISKSIRSNLNGYKKIIAFCGNDYIEAIRKALPEMCIVEPLRGMGIGQRLKFLSEVNQI